jgi:hypothetical protein
MEQENKQKEYCPCLYQQALRLNPGKRLWLTSKGTIRFWFKTSHSNGMSLFYGTASFGDEVNTAAAAVYSEIGSQQ